jgi:phosphatidylglycerophosphate synthase
VLIGAAAVLWFLASRWRPSRAPVARAQQWLRKAAECLLAPRNAAVHLPLSLLLVVCSLLQLYVASRAIGVALPLSHLFWLGPLILLAAAVPSFFGGWGIREGASALLFGAAGMSESSGVAVSMVYGTFALVSSLPGLLVVLFDSERTSREKVKPWTYANALSMLVATAFVLWLSYPPLLAFVGALCFFFLVAQARGAWTPRGSFGLPNTVTTLRLVLTMAMLLAFAREPAWVLAGAALVNLLLDVVDGWLARRSGLSGEFGARYDIEADALLVLALGILLHHRGLAGPWVILAGAWRYLYVLTPLVFPTPKGEARRSRHGRFAYVLMLTCFMVTLVLPVGVGAPLALLGTVAVSLSFLHSFWERYAPARSSISENGLSANGLSEDEVAGDAE